MDEFIEVYQYIFMQILNYFIGEFAANLLDSINMLISFPLYLALKNCCLHLVIILEEIFSNFIDELLLFLQIIVNLGSHPSKKTVYFIAFLKFHTLWSVAEVSVSILFFELLAPFCEYSQDLRTLNFQISDFNFILGKQRCVFRYFPSNQVMGILLHFGSVFIFLLHFLSDGFSSILPTVFSYLTLLTDNWSIIDAEFDVDLLTILLLYPFLILHLFK